MTPLVQLLATEADAGGVEAHASDFSTVFRACQPGIGSYRAFFESAVAAASPTVMREQAVRCNWGNTVVFLVPLLQSFHTAIYRFSAD
ncbi:MAG: hypothetical protein ABFD46_11840 [Armatimonadota bacterium]